MTTQLTIPTPFADLAELTESFSQRVDEQRLMLPNAEPMPEGEWVQFDVQLADGTSALAGVGRVQGAFDNGEEHPAEYRFDVVLESLQLEGMHEVMFERLLVARETQMKGEPVTGEVSVEELERQGGEQAAAADDDDEGAWSDSTVAAPEAALYDGADAGYEDAAPEHDAADHGAADHGAADHGAADHGAAGHDAPAYADAEHADAAEIDHGTGEIDVGDIVEPAHAAPARPAAKAPKIQYPVSAPREPGKLPSPHTFNGRALTRASHPAAWSPEPSQRPDPAQSSGLFDYQGGVPRPAQPPRPELDASQRVQPAPRPGAPWPRRGTGSHAVPAAAIAAESADDSAEHGEAFEDLSEGEPVPVAAEEDDAEASEHAPAAGENEREEW